MMPTNLKNIKKMLKAKKFYLNFHLKDLCELMQDGKLRPYAFLLYAYVSYRSYAH